MQYAPTIFGGILFLLGIFFQTMRTELAKNGTNNTIIPFARMDALPIFIFAAMEGVCDTHLQFLVEDFSYWDLLSLHANGTWQELSEQV